MSISVALDIESTGFDPRLDQIIEIAAIKFDGEKIIDSFETLLNPGMKIPSIISHITNIHDEDVADAPRFDDIREKLVEFLGNHPIVGHNIEFDVIFLIGKGLKLKNKMYDTLQLSAILLPGLASYSLDTLSRVLKISHDTKHRAMPDTKASYELFLLLKKKIDEIPSRTLAQIHELLKRSTWTMKELFLSAHGNRTRKPKKTEPHIEDTKYAKSLDIDEAQLLQWYDHGGKIEKSMKDYEPRPSQREMTSLILESFYENRKKLIEAGTGIGKTLAYLLAAAFWSLKNNQKVVISTHTRNLQSQILEKDLPLIQELISPAKCKVALVKGRRNYLSQKRLELFQRRDSFEDHEICFLIKILLWLPKTETGDLEELTLQGKEFGLPDEVCCGEYVCPHEDPEFKNQCFLVKAREKALQADIIVINHALLLQDAIAETPILPEYLKVIIDEAHQLERVATDTLTVILSFHSFQRPFDKIKKLLRMMGRNLKDAASMGKCKDLRQQVDSLIGRIEIFFGLVGIFLEKHLPSENTYSQLNLMTADLQSKEWIQVREAGKMITENGKEMLEQISGMQETLQEWGNKEWKEIKGNIYECQKKLADLQSILESEEQALDQITWIYKSYEENVSMRRSPVDVGPILAELFFSRKESVILTSATLRTDHSFNFIRSELGLDESFSESFLPSHFSFPDQVKILIPEDLPEPATEGYFLNCAKVISDIIVKNGGRTLVLFTSKKTLSATYHQVAPDLKQKGFIVLAQHITGGRGKIIEHFKDEPGNCAIFGTSSFWEGIDIQGNDLNCVIIQKLPFDPPNDPMVVARSKKYADSFNQYQLPRAILRFKQGFGRLIRSNTDTGSIVVLDTRIIQKSYGRKFLESIPEGIRIEYGSMNNLPDFL